MPQENVEIVRRAIDAWNRQEVEDVLDLAAPEVEYVNQPTAVEPGTRRGHDGLAGVVRAQWEALPGGHQEIDRIHERGEEVISVGRASRLMPGGGARIDTPILLSWTIRDGKISRIEVLGFGPEFHKALEAAGLRE
jgi:ketosteroid isomerase-like protein